MRLSFVVALAAIGMASAARVQAQAYFVGHAVVDLGNSGNERTVRLVQPFAFHDADGSLWPVPAGTIVDGASIPQPFWSFIGGPFEGKYREASIIHDYYCDARTRAWPAVHRMFYDAMVASGVDTVRAKVMYYAVYRFGPRWEQRKVKTHSRGFGGKILTRTRLATVKLSPPVYNQARAEQDIQRIEQQDLSLAQIEQLAGAR